MYLYKNFNNNLNYNKVGFFYNIIQFIKFIYYLFINVLCRIKTKMKYFKKKLKIF